MNTVLEKTVQNDVPTFVVTSANWTMEVQLNAFNSQFTLEHQVLEVGSIAVSVFKGMRSEPPIEMMPDHLNDRPMIGTTLLVHIKGQPPEQAALLYTHTLLANIGCYQDSAKMEAVLTKQVSEISEKLAKEAEQKKITKANIDNRLFDALKAKTFTSKKKESNVTRETPKSPRKVRKGK